MLDIRQDGGGGRGAVDYPGGSIGSDGPVRSRNRILRALWFAAAAGLLCLSLAGVWGWANSSNFGGKVRANPVGVLNFANPIGFAFQVWDRFLSAFPHPALISMTSADSEAQTAFDKLASEYESIEPRRIDPDGSRSGSSNRSIRPSFRIEVEGLRSKDIVRIITCHSECIPAVRRFDGLVPIPRRILDTAPKANLDRTPEPEPMRPLPPEDIEGGVVIDTAGAAFMFGKDVQPSDFRGFTGGFGVGVIIPSEKSGVLRGKEQGPAIEKLIVVSTGDGTALPLSAYFVTRDERLLRILSSGSEVADPEEVANGVNRALFASSTLGWANWAVEAEIEEADIYTPTLQNVFQTSDGGDNWTRLSYRHLPAPWIFAALLLSVFAFERGTRAHQKLNPVSDTPSVADHGVSDDPVGLDDLDALGLRPIAKSVSRFIRNVDTTPTVTLGITGPWGSGKSSLMKMVAEDLKRNRARSVWFNAWHHQKEDSLLAALLAAIRAQAIPPVWTLPGLHYRIRVALYRVIQDPARSLALVVLAVVAIMLVSVFGEQAIQVIKSAIRGLSSLFSQAPPPPSGKDQSVIAPEAIASVGLSTGGIGGLVFAVKQVWDLFKPLKTIPSDLLASVSEQAKPRDLDQQLSFRFRFAREFNTFCNLLRSPPHPGLVIFVDDLDRCLPRQTVEVLEAINFVTTAGPCFVILGFDEAKVRAAIADVYKDTLLKIDENSNDAPGRPGGVDLRNFATNYLEKLVHLAIPVPRSTEDTVAKLLGIGVSSARASATIWRSQLRRLEEPLGTLLVLAFFGVSAYLSIQVLTRFEAVPTTAVPPIARIETVDATAAPARPAPNGTSSSATSPAAAAKASPRAPEDRRPVLERLGITQTHLSGVAAPIPLSATFLLVIILAMQYIPRLTSVPTVEDSNLFKDSLQVWIPVIAARRDTPRAVKRFVNRVRFLAMRSIDAEREAALAGKHVPLDEGLLVTFAAIEDADASFLGKARERILVSAAKAKSEANSAALVRDGLEKFERTFRRDPYTHPDSVKAYRAIAGVIDHVEEKKPVRARKKAAPA